MVDIIWIAPPAVLGLGVAAIAAMVHAVDKATTQAQGAHRRFRRLENGLIPLRVETRRTRESMDRLHRR